MSDPISISKILSIRECGFGESWLQDQIAKNPKILGLGDLVLVEREKREIGGGKLDILLKTRDGDTVFEVETMLGETDGDHISRTIEYWDLEQRQDTIRRHFPVLIAEDVTRRFFNLIHRFSMSIPIIAIKVNIIDIEGKRALHFTTILNAFSESKTERRKQFEPKATVSDEQSWEKKSPITVVCAKELLHLVLPAFPDAKLNFFKFGLTINRGKRCYFWFKEGNDDKKCRFFLWVGASRNAKAKEMIESAGLPLVFEKENIAVRVNLEIIKANSRLFQQIARLVNEAWNN